MRLIGLAKFKWIFFRTLIACQVCVPVFAMAPKPPKLVDDTIPKPSEISMRNDSLDIAKSDPQQSNIMPDSNTVTALFDRLSKDLEQAEVFLRNREFGKAKAIAKEIIEKVQGTTGIGSKAPQYLKIPAVFSFWKEGQIFDDLSVTEKRNVVGLVQGQYFGHFSNLLNLSKRATSLYLSADYQQKTDSCSPLKSCLTEYDKNYFRKQIISASLVPLYIQSEGEGTASSIRLLFDIDVIEDIALYDFNRELLSVALSADKIFASEDAYESALLDYRQKMFRELRKDIEILLKKPLIGVLKEQAEKLKIERNKHLISDMMTKVGHLGEILVLGPLTFEVKNPTYTGFPISTSTVTDKILDYETQVCNHRSRIFHSCFRDQSLPRYNNFIYTCGEFFSSDKSTNCTRTDALHGLSYGGIKSMSGIDFICRALGATKAVSWKSSELVNFAIKIERDLWHPSSAWDGKIEWYRTFQDADVSSMRLSKSIHSVVCEAGKSK